MEQIFEFLTLYLAALGGIALHLLVKVRDSRTKNKKMDWPGQLLNAGIAALICIILVAVRHSLEGMFVLTHLLAASIGYNADSVWKNVSKYGESKMNKLQ